MPVQLDRDLAGLQVYQEGNLESHKVTGAAEEGPRGGDQEVRSPGAGLAEQASISAEADKQGRR